MDLSKFSDYYPNELLQKLSSGKKSVILLSDSNVDVMKYVNHHSTDEFLDSLSSQFFFLILHNQLELEIYNINYT